jgi:gamma-glutamyltranspeptidase/glutathione hydrolase
MVVSAQHLASDVGLAILRQGGNAIDAAVAVGYALAVVYPCCGNIGGGGFMTIHLADGRDTVINFRETAPAAAGPAMFLDNQGHPIKALSLSGYLAAGVPGTVMGLDRALREYGTLRRAKVMAPAIALARNGFVLGSADAALLAFGAGRIAKDPVAAKIFLRPDGTPFQAGDRLVQKDLARTLVNVAAQGPNAFYKGPIAKAVDLAARAHGGILTAADFALYTAPEDTPLRCDYRGFGLVTVPPPSSGGVTLCEILRILEGYDMTALGFHSARAVHLMVEAMRHAFQDRNTLLGDPASVDNPLDRLLSKEHAAAIRAQIDPDKATPSPQTQPVGSQDESGQTTHFSVVDDKGNAVSLTFTINLYFGAGVIAPGTGFFLNDEMDDFAVKPGATNVFGLVQDQANTIAPGKRPLSSMAPTLVTQNGRVLLVTGSPGGPRIITITLETIINVLDYGMTPQEAVDAPRIHHQWFPDEVFIEPYALSPDTRDLLQGMGYRLTEGRPWGASELIEIGPLGGATSGAPAAGQDEALTGRPRAGFLYGANDSRAAAGAAVGY